MPVAVVVKVLVVGNNNNYNQEVESVSPIHRGHILQDSEIRQGAADAS